MAKLIKLWIVGSAACVCAGWTLSALHDVTLGGYALFFTCLAVVCGVVFARWRATGRIAPIRAGARGPRLNKRRLRRPLPFLFLLTAILAFVGGAVHSPNNYDALTYRFPRMLQWWAGSGWHWISTPNERMNLSGTNFEWMMMPIYAITHSDRFFFLINIVAYIFLPSLIFVVFVACGVARRAAWFWMWVLPTGLCFAMQAGSISNDTIAASYFLGALYFAFRAKRTRAVRDVWLSILAAGLLTGIKASNLPLALPILWVIWPSLLLLNKRFIASAAILFVSASVSFLPSAALNRCYTGDWSGDPHNVEHIKLDSPIAGILGNGLQVGLQSLEPPFLPLARTVENWIWDRFPERLQSILKAGFPRFVIGFRELPQEESAGLGIGITVLLIASIAAALRYRRRHQTKAFNRAEWQGLVVSFLTWISLFVYMTKLGSESTSRLIAAYYPLVLLPALLNDAQRHIVRERWFQILGICTAAIAVAALILTPSRPLWPSEQFFDWATVQCPHNGLLAEAKKVYSVYRSRNDLFGQLRRCIPDSIPVLGVIEGSDDAESSLWRPYGARRVVHVLPGERQLESELQWLVVKDSVVASTNHGGFGRWLEKDGGVLVTNQLILEKASINPEEWSVVRFPGPQK